METVPLPELGWNDSRRDTTSEDNHFAVNHFDGIVRDMLVLFVLVCLAWHR